MPSDTFTLSFSGTEINQLLQLLNTASSDLTGDEINSLLQKIKNQVSYTEGNVNYNANSNKIKLEWINIDK